MARCNFGTLLILMSLALHAPAAWSAGFDESVDGDISGTRNNPTRLLLTYGSNVVVGFQGSPDIDFLHVIVPPGHVLEALLVLPGTMVGNGRSFIGVQRGSQFTVDPAAPNEEDLLGYTHIDMVSAARDLLPAIGEGFGAQGYTGPLAAGDYTFWIMETVSGSFPFRFDFVVAAESPVEAPVQVPAMSALCLAASSLTLVAIGIRRLRRDAA